MSITSDEVNFLIYRYLQECGFVHSAFTFAYESQIAKSSVVTADVPPGALISFVQKGLQYVTIEAHVNEDGTERECDEELSLLHPHSCQIAQSGTRTLGKSTKRKRKDDSKQSNIHDNEFSSRDVTKLVGHKAEVFICSWSPTENVLASGSGDSTARIWNIPDNHNPGDSVVEAPFVLTHNNDTGANKDVTTLSWNGDGTYLASGSYDGQGRIWSKTGELRSVLTYHNGPIFALKWSKNSSMLLSGSYDKSAAVWDVASGKVKQHYLLHQAPTLDVDWKDDVTFATCSTDKTIKLCNVGDSKNIRTLLGHTDEVNTVKWSPSGSLLASCSDDHTTKIWNPSCQDTFVHDLKEHTKEIYTIKWSPTGPNSPHPNKKLILASASFDATVKLWDVETGKCLFTLEHEDPVYSVAFSPDGDYIASGALNGALHIWSVRSGEVVKSYSEGNGDIFEVGWNFRSDMVAACYSDNSLCVLNFRK